VRFEVLARRPHGMLLRIAPPIPGSLDSAIDEVEPIRKIDSRLFSGTRLSRKGEHFPHAVIADDCDKWLACGPSGVSIWTWEVGVGGHQPLLDRKHKIVGGMKGCGWEWRIASSEPQLKGADRIAQSWWRLRPVLQSQ
jgi:hypothetical protein